MLGLFCRRHELSVPVALSHPAENRVVRERAVLCVTASTALLELTQAPANNSNPDQVICRRTPKFQHGFNGNRFEQTGCDALQRIAPDG
jgi:hypothetical protein